LPKDKAERRLGLAAHPLGPPSDPGIVQAAPFYDAILTGRPYPVKALVVFGNDPLLSHGDPARGVEALGALDFYAHVDLFANPSASFADLLGSGSAKAELRREGRHPRSGRLGPAAQGPWYRRAARRGRISR
jgi:hypothetical protein